MVVPWLQPEINVNIFRANLILQLLLETPVICKKPPPLNHGSVKLNDGQLQAGATIMYSCFKGYQLRGERGRKCLPTGEWSGGNPSCEKISKYAYNNNYYRH